MQRRAPGNEGVKRSPYHKPKRTKKPYHGLSSLLAGMQACHARPTATTACKTTPRAGLGIPPGSFTLQGAPQNLTLLAAAWSHRRRLLTASEVPKTATSSKIPHWFCLNRAPSGDTPQPGRSLPTSLRGSGCRVSGMQPGLHPGEPRGHFLRGQGRQSVTRRSCCFSSRRRKKNVIFS